jgi:hypothetical protein
VKQALFDARYPPKLACSLDWIDSELLPPYPFVASTVSCPVMNPAQRGDEFVAHFSAERARLHEAKMVGIGRLSPAHQTGLLGDEAEMLLIAVARWFGELEHAFIDMFNLELCGGS